MDDLLDVSRVTRGLVTSKRERVDLVDAVRRALESVQGLLDDKAHRVVLELPPTPVVVSGDPVRLEQILVNLLANAGKYTDPGGQIALSVDCRGGCAEIRVRDNGIGMTSENLDRIFELFSQADRSLARSQGGLGIGLTIAKRLVELHGGSIEAASDGPGCGSTFTVRLPLAAGAAATQAPPEVSAGAVGQGRRVLVVDDAIDIAETLAMLLADSGHEVAVAHDGRGALTKAVDFAPELILLDIGLPGLDGYEVARRLRSDPRTQHTVIVALSGYGHAEDLRRAAAAGFDRHFVKPVDLDELEAFVRDAGAQATS